MLTHRGFSAWIESEEKPLPEYLPSVNPKTHQMSCWIPAEAGKKFTVHWKDNGDAGKIDTCGFITLDGYVVPGRFLHGEGTTWRSGIRVSKNTERPFIFQHVGETDGKKSDERREQEVGKITLRIKRVKIVSAVKPNPIGEAPDIAAVSTAAGELRVGFGPETSFTHQHLTTWGVEPYEKRSSETKQPRTYVSFVFRYRSPSFLAAQGIPTDEKPSKIAAPKIHKRRIASVPHSMPSFTTPSPVPSRVPSPMYYRNGSQRIKQPIATDGRRAVSMKLTSKEVTTPEDVESCVDASKDASVIRKDSKSVQVTESDD